MKNKRKQHGWIYEVKKPGCKKRYVRDLYPIGRRESWTYSLGRAHVFTTRRDARNEKQEEYELICKVQLDCNGKPMWVLSRGQ